MVLDPFTQSVDFSLTTGSPGSCMASVTCCLATANANPNMLTLHTRARAHELRGRAKGFRTEGAKAACVLRNCTTHSHPRDHTFVPSQHAG